VLKKGEMQKRKGTRINADRRESEREKSMSEEQKSTKDTKDQCDAVFGTRRCGARDKSDESGKAR